MMTTTTTVMPLLVGLLLSAQATIFVVASECIDNPNYITKLGLTCDQHNQWKCEGFASAGFTPDEVEELLTNCPVSCGTCEGAAGQRQRRRQQQMMMTSRKEQMRQTVMDELKGRADIVDVRREAQEELTACHEGWLPFCRDDPTYNSQIDLPCWAHAVIDCTALVDIGFTELEVMDLVEHCPCSCNVECGTFTLSPTSSPTDAPTITRKPTESPTRRPTNKPTPAPTPRPTPAPITPFPSLSPTPAPSTEPTKAPTGTPTTSPTSLPTATPTVAPTATASAPPSAAPTGVPTDVPTSPIIVTPRIQKPQRPQQDDDSNTFSIFIIAGIAVGGVAFAVLAAILFFKMGRGPRTPSTTMPPKSKKKTKAMHKLILAELQQNPTATSRSEAGGSEEDSDGHDSVEEWMENPTVSSFHIGGQTPKAKQAETAQQMLERQLHAYHSRPRQILRDDISMATKDIGNVEVELAAHEASQRAQQGRGTKFRNFIGRALSPRATKSWYEEEYGQPQADEGASEDNTSFDQSEAVEEAMVAARSASGLTSAFSGETPRAGNHVGQLLAPSHSGSAGSASRGATIHSHNTRRNEELVYKGANKAGKSPEVEIVCAPDIEAGCAASAQEEPAPAKMGFFRRLFRKKEPKKEESAPVQDIDLEDCNTLSRFTMEGNTFDGPVDTNPSGILRGMGSDTAETVKGGVSFGPKTKFGSGASMSSGSTHPSKSSSRKSTGSKSSGFFWNAIDESGACIEKTATCGKSELLRRESSGAIPMQGGVPMNAPSRLSAIPTLNTTKDDATMEVGEVERQLSGSSNSLASSSKSESSSRRGVDMPMASKGSLVSSSTDKTPRASHSSSSKSKARSADMAAPPVPVTRSASASTASAKSASQAVGRIRSLPKGARPKANRLIAQATSYDDESINEKDLEIAMVQAPMRMQASIATEEEESVASGHPHSEPTAKNHNRSQRSRSSRRGDQEVIRSASTRSLSTKDEEGKGENEWDGTCEPIAHDPPVANVKPFAFARVESGITTPTTIQPSQSALKHIDSSPSYESTYNGRPRTSEKYKNDQREEEEFARQHRHSSRHRSSSRHRHHREHIEDRPPRSSSRRREHSRERHHDDRRHDRDYDGDDRRRSRDRHHHDDDRRQSRSLSRHREGHTERRHRSRSHSRHHHHDGYNKDRRRSRSRDERRHRESSRHHSSRRQADEQSEEGALFRPKIPFMPSDSTDDSYHH